MKTNDGYIDEEKVRQTSINIQLQITQKNKNMIRQVFT